MSRMVRRAGSRLRRDANWLNGNALSAVSCPQGTNPDLHRLWGMAKDLDRRLEELELQLAEQQNLVRRMIVRGTPSEAAEDRLRQLQQQLAQSRSTPMK
jgi:hypothetical protein